MTFEVIVRDNGEPPLESKAVIELKVLDINDNSPRFEQTMYEGTVLENQPIGAKILKVSAKDLDSEHFGKVSYSLSGEDAEFLAVTDDGWVELAKPIDYESKKLIRANLKALDGGQPALSDEALLSITIQDVNEHPPQFSDCHMNAVVQEGVQAGQSLLTVQLTDKDSPQNGPPFRLEIRGNGASAFTFDPMLNLITTRQLSYAQQKVFNLNVTAFDARGLSQTCPLTILVKQQSLHPPEVKPLLITLNALYGEFLVNGKLGKIRAIDRDQADLLRYSIIEAVNHAPSSLSFDHSKLQSTSIHVDAATGELSAITEMLPGLHRFNISVTDGKFVVHTPITIDVSNIDQDALDHSISLQLSGLTAERFVKDHMEKFIGILSRLLSVPLTYVRILSVQDVDKSVRLRRGLQPTPTVIAQAPQISNSEIEVLLTVSRGESRGFHRPSFVKQRISEGIATLTAETGLEISSLTTEICRSDTCSKGECRDRLWLDNVDLLRIEDEKNGNYYMYPKFLRTYQCICNEGYGGAKCDVAVNQCSREMCTKYEMCIPSSSEANGFACSCAPGLKGDRCAAPTCEKPAECSQKESISLLGNGYFQLFVAQNLEARMELLVEFKTVSRNAYLMHGAGHVDFHSILIENGYVEYRWNCGTGMGQVKIPHIRVDDGQWHTLKIMRRGRQVKLMLDSHQAEGASPPGSDVVNLYSQATILTFGAQLLASAEQTNNQSNWLHHRQHYYGQRQTASELANQVENGTIGCFRRIGLDGTELPKMEQGLRLFNARIGCDTQTMGVCLNAPCQNNGQCVPKSEPNAYSCICSERYTGSNCEIDLNACADSPCPPSVACHNLYNDFHCQCPPSFTGKTCQMRDDWDPCVTNPCGQFGQCIRYKSSFICNCSTGFGGQFCMDRVPKMSSDNWSLQSPELYILFGIFLAAFLCALLAIIACRRQNRSAVGGKSPSRADNDSGRLPSTDDPTNALIPQTPRINPPIYQNTVERVLVPPPIPPKNAVRVPRSNNHTLLSSGLPTQEVRPLQVTQRLNGHLCCPTPPQSSKGSFSSAKMSFMKGQNHYDETYEETPKPVPPPHRFLIENDESSKLLARGVIVKNPLKKEKVASNPTTSMSSLDNASSSGDYLTMKPVKKKKDKTKQSNGTVENGVHNEEENTGDQHS
ncbi:hypothetical protein M3Y97_00214000 [Aphelenchoides bicaudatus]|nr:hypothetical protein M3Y97_00214000 [Aphelenchoides bicaudatus]